MKKYSVYIAVTVLVLASLACQALSRLNTPPALPQTEEDSNPPVNDATEPPADPYENDDSGGAVNSEFPMTDDAYNVTEIGNGSVLYYTKMSLEDVLQFYRDEYTSRGYTERELVTFIEDGVFSIVFDGDPSGKAIAIQSVDLGDGSRTVAIQMDDF